jgi:hypothetical protein
MIALFQLQHITSFALREQMGANPLTRSINSVSPYDGLSLRR